MEFNLINLVLVTIIQLIGAMIQTAVGYGMVLFTGPLLMLLEPKMVPGPSLFGVMFLSVFVTILERRSLDVFGMKWMFAGRILSATLSAFILTILPPSYMAFIFSFLILAAVAMSLSGRRFPPTRPVMFSAGFISGIMGTFAALGGPPVALVNQDLPGPKLRATLAGYFILGTIFSILVLIPAGKFGWTEIWLSLSLLPGTFLGLLLGRRLVNFLDRGYTRVGVLVVAIIASLTVIINQIINMQ